MGILNGKVAIITGASKGIGLATTKIFLDEGAKVVMTDVDAVEGQEQANQLGNDALFVTQDVSKEDTWPKVFTKAEDTFGTVNILVNNAGIGGLENAENITLNNFHKVLAVDLDGVMLGQKYGIIHMKKQGGSIINFSSILGLVGSPEAVAYQAAKGAVRLITKSAALYCSNKGYPVRINSIHPGYVHTPLIDESMVDSLAKLHPMGRLAEPEEIANLVVYLASDKSSFSTGSEFVADGGYTAQ